MKYAEVKILPHHVNFLESTIQNGAMNQTNSLWLAAFAIYNTENKIKLGPSMAMAYEKVFKHIKNKLS